MRTIEELLSEARNHELNIVQWRERMTYPAHPNDHSKPIGDWWCEVRHKNGHRDSDTGQTAQGALHRALERAKGLLGPENRPNAPLVKPKPDITGLTDEEAELM